MRCLRMELFKLKRKKMLLLIIVFLIVETFWAFMSVNISIARNPSHPFWESFFATIASMNCLFYPILCSIIASRLCDMETKENTWKLLAAFDIKRSYLYLLKFMTCFILSLFAAVFQLILMYILGVLKTQQTFPLSHAGYFILGILIINLALLALQQWLSLRSHNQVIALIVGMVGGFIGMIGAFFPVGIRQFIVWSSYMDLTPVQYTLINNEYSLIVRGPQLSGFIIPLFVLLVFYGIGSCQFSVKEL